MNRDFRYCPICGTLLRKARRDKKIRLLCTKCGWVNYQNPLPSVAALVKNPKGEILLIKRGVPPGKGKWALPSGFIEIDETPETAVLRELREETNTTGGVRRLIGVYNEHTETYGNVLLIGYEVEKLKGKIRAGSDTKEIKFFPTNYLPAIPFSSHRAIIRDSLSLMHSETTSSIEILKSKIQEAVITKTELFYEGSIGIDETIMKAADIISGEKVQVLNYDNGERFETYVIKQKENSGDIILYGPAAWKGKVGDRVCILSYVLSPVRVASEIKAKIIRLNNQNGII